MPTMKRVDIRKFRPFKLVAVLMVVIAMIMTIVSLAGPDWVNVTAYNGEAKSLGLWWECFKVHSSLNLCINADWLNACAAMIILAMLGNIVTLIFGIVGLWSWKRLPYFLAGVVCLVCILFLVISLIIYPVKFVDEVKSDDRYKSETSKILFDWTYGLAWGAVCFLIGAAIFFFIHLKDEHNPEVHQMTSVHQYYNHGNTGSAPSLHT